MEDTVLTSEEFAALEAIDSSIRQRRPSVDVEVRLRHLGLIERSGLSQMPARTAKGEALVKARQADRAAQASVAPERSRAAE